MLQILAAIFWLLLVPFGCGMWINSRMGKEHQSIGNIFVSGYLIMIALFQCWYLAFFMAGSISFETLTWVFAIFIVLFAGVSAWFGRGIIKTCLTGMKNKEAIVYKIIFGLFLVAQLGMRLVQQVSDGDDAYYIATAAIAYTGGTMNMVAPYTGFIVTYIDYRHAFASAPYLLAFFSKLTMIPPAAMAHSVFSLVLIVLHYCVVLNVGELLFKGKKQEKYLFAILVSLFNVYGFVSIYTAQTFLLTRTWQGKSMFANLIIPALTFLLLWMCEKDKKEKLEIVYFIFASAIMFAGTAMTTLAVVMLPLAFMIGIAFLSVYRKQWALLLKGAVACIPSVVLGIIYIMV